MSIAENAVAPDFTVRNELDETVTLSSLLAERKPLVLFFYPKADTPG